MILVGPAEGRVVELCRSLQEHPVARLPEIPVTCLGNLGRAAGHDYFLNHRTHLSQRVLFGNYDALDYLYSVHSLGNYDYWPTPAGGVLFVRGGVPDPRRPGGRAEDELTGEEFRHLTNYLLRSAFPVDVVVSYELPRDAADRVLHQPNPSQTGQGLQAVLAITRPQRWITAAATPAVAYDPFYYQNTHFQCLRPLEYLTLEG